MPDLHTPDTQFVFGKATQLTPHCNNYDITFFAIGETVAPAFLASKTLSEAVFDCCVLSFHSLRPFDEGAVRLAAEQSKAVITVEEHSINGGLGSRVASFLCRPNFVPENHRPSMKPSRWNKEEMFNIREWLLANSRGSTSSNRVK